MQECLHIHKTCDLSLNTGDIPADITTQQDYLHRKYGDIVKMAGLPGRSDMVMIYDPDEIEKVIILFASLIIEV